VALVVIHQTVVAVELVDTALVSAHLAVELELS
jgi:hypothetical protein